MIVVNRFRAGPGFDRELQPAVEILRAKPGCLDIEVGLNLDDPGLWVMVSRWENVGSYRRALGGFESKSVVVPLLSRAIDEPTAYAAPDEVGDNLPRGF